MTCFSLIALQVEKVFDASHPDPMEIEKAKKALKVRAKHLLLPFILHGLSLQHFQICNVSFEMQDHEQALVDAIARLEDASDGESGNK